MSELENLRAGVESRSDAARDATRSTSHAQAVQRLVDAAVYRYNHSRPRRHATAEDEQPSSAPAAEIVVGVDGSPASHAALRWAVAHAAPLAATVVAVEVDQLPRVAPPSDPARLHAAVLDAEPGPDHGPDVTEVRVSGEPAAELVRIAANADLIVLGHTPRGRLAEFVLGGTAADCLRRTKCPVVLVPSDER